MARVIDPPVHCRTTDHSDEILRLQDIADELRGMEPLGAAAKLDWKLRVAAIETAAALLQCHDDTGISLDNWYPGPKELVNTVLEQYEMGELLENHV